MLPALPLDEAGKYVAAAYLVFLLLILVYVAIMASKLSRIEREVVEIADLVDRKGSDPLRAGGDGNPPPASRPKEKVR